MPQAIEISRPYEITDPWQQGLYEAQTGQKVPGHRINYNNYPGLIGDYTIGVRETFAGVDPANINFKFPLRAFQRGFFQSNTTTSSAIKEDIKTLILTAKGERIIQPDVGTNIPTLAGQVFENIDIEEMQMLIETEIREAVQRWMPFVNITNITVKDSVTDNSLKINQIRVSMRYSVSSARIQDTVGFVISGE